MKFKKLKRVISVGVLGVMLTSLSACSFGKKVEIKPMEKEEVHALSFDFIGGKDVMPIGGFYGPTVSKNSYDGQSLPDYLTDDIMGMIAECGLNMINVSDIYYGLVSDDSFKLLELGEKHDLGIFVTDMELITEDGGYPMSLETLSQRLTAYSDYPAFCGVMMTDEPGNDYYYSHMQPISEFATTYRNLKKLDVVGYVNLLPLYEMELKEGYIKMLEEFCSTCDPYYLCYDYYLWSHDNGKEDYFYNMDLIRQYAEESEIPFWCMIQAGGQFSDAATAFDSGPLFPTEAQLQWNINTALAYGAKGFKYFPIIQPMIFAHAVSTDFDFQRNGLLGLWGNKTQWWYYAKNMNKQIAAIDAVLMNSVNKGIIATGERAKKDLEVSQFLMEGDSWRELKRVEGNTMIGCFNYQGKTALYVVNYEESYAQKVTLHLQDDYNLSVTQKAEVSRINTDQLDLDLQPGEGVLVVFD